MTLEDTYTTIRIYREDRPRLENVHRSMAEAVRFLLRRCEHPLSSRQYLGNSEIYYPEDKRTVQVQILKCLDCGTEIVLPGQPPEKESEEA